MPANAGDSENIAADDIISSDPPPVLADGSTPVTGVLTATGAGAIRMPVYDTGGTVHNLRASATVGTVGVSDSAAIQAWYDALPAGAHALIPSGVYEIDTGLTFNRPDVDIEFRGSFLYTGNGASPAVTLGTTTAGTAFIAPIYSGHLSIRRASITGAGAGGAGTFVGLRLANLRRHQGPLQVSVEFFRRGIDLYANDQGVVYNTLRVRFLRNIENLGTTLVTSSSWTNQNTVAAGNWINDGTTKAEADLYNITPAHVIVGDAARLETDAFVMQRCSFEGVGGVDVLRCENGYYTLDNCRYEASGTGLMYIRVGPNTKKLDVTGDGATNLTWTTELVRAHTEVTTSHGLIHHFANTIGMGGSAGTGAPAILRHALATKIIEGSGLLWRIVDAVRTMLVVQGTRGVEILSGCYYDRITATYVKPVSAAACIRVVMDPDKDFPQLYRQTANVASFTSWTLVGDIGAPPLASIAAAPPYAGRLAVVGGVGYLATGTASAADWKQIT